MSDLKQNLKRLKIRQKNNEALIEDHQDKLAECWVTRDKIEIEIKELMTQEAGTGKTCDDT